MDQQTARKLITLERRLDGLVKPEIGGWHIIAETTLAAPAATVTFASIPDIYRALVAIVQARTDRAAEWDALNWRANADGGNNYDYVILNADGGGGIAAVPGRALAMASLGLTEAANSRANNFSVTVGWWPGYAKADREKHCLSDSEVMGNLDADADMIRTMRASHWRNTNAITSLTFLPAVGPNFVAGCIFTLYGVF